MKAQTYILKVAVGCLTLLAAVSLTPGAWGYPKSVALPAGSVNALAAAIVTVGPGGTVVLESGLHQESGEVLVPFPVEITGKPGAVLETATSPATVFPLEVEAALHLKNAPGAAVEGIWFRPPAGTIGNCAVILEDSPGARVVENQMTGLQYGIFVQGSDHAMIGGNTITITTAWESGALPDAEGIISSSGRHVQVRDNQISSALFGIFASDRSGQLTGNTLTGNFFGFFFCHNRDIGAPYYYAFAGVPQFGPEPASGWEVQGNIAHGNAWGLLVTDGSHANVLVDNDAFGNGDPAVWGVLGYDIELTGDTTRFAPDPPLAAASYNNLVVAGQYRGLVLKDCGAGNVIHGAVKLVDTSKDACY